MSPPSPNPTTVFRWEDSSALEHSCWACTTKSNSPKAIHTCYGIHSIPCMAYHSTMHAIGTSHRCSGCTISREMHENRHREIAKLVAEYHSTDCALETPPRRRALALLAPNMQLRNSVQIEQHQNSNADIFDENDKRSYEHDTASTSTSSDNQSLLKLTKAEQRERKRNTKVEKSVQKAVKNESRHTVQVTAKDVERIELILHGPQDKEQTQTHPLATDKAIEDVIARNLGFVKQIQCHKQALYETIRIGRKEQEERRRNRRRISQGAEDVETEAVIDAILVKLGIDSINKSRTRKGKTTSKQKTTPSKNNEVKPVDDKARVVSKLREAIRDDLEKHENDLRQTYIRAGGFFRYAGKAVFERMTEIARNIDLQTGEEWDKRRKREAQSEVAEAQRLIEDDDDNEADGEE